MLYQVGRRCCVIRHGERKSLIGRFPELPYQEGLGAKIGFSNSRDCPHGRRCFWQAEHLASTIVRSQPMALIVGPWFCVLRASECIRAPTKRLPRPRLSAKVRFQGFVFIVRLIWPLEVNFEKRAQKGRDLGLTRRRRWRIYTCGAAGTPQIVETLSIHQRTARHIRGQLTRSASVTGDVVSFKDGDFERCRTPWSVAQNRTSAIHGHWRVHLDHLRKTFISHSSSRFRSPRWEWGEGASQTATPYRLVDSNKLRSTPLAWN